MSKSLLVTLLLILAGTGGRVRSAVGEGAAALLTDEVSQKLGLTADQRQQIESIRRATAKKTNDLQSSKAGKRGLKEEVARSRQMAQDEAVAILNPEQRAIWAGLASQDQSSPSPGKKDEIASRSLLIPTIQELKHPSSPNAYGPNASVLQTQPHPPVGNAYVVLTDYSDADAIAALNRLADFRHGTIVRTSSLGDLPKSESEFGRLQKELRSLAPKYVAIAPKPESYRENMHLCMLKLLSSLDDQPGLDVFPGYLVAANSARLRELVDRTIAFHPLTHDQIKPALIGTIEDDGDTKYRAYQKAKILQKMFAEQGKNTPAIFMVTNPEVAARPDFPKFNPDAGDISMMSDRKHQAFQDLSDSAKQAMSGKNVLFMFGHGLPDRLCGTRVSAFAPIDFTNEIVFCGSCMSASPAHADRVDLEKQAGTRRFGSLAQENGAVMVLGHMGLCGGFPEVYPVAEHMFEGLSAGEAYQRVMNALIGKPALPDYYATPPPKESNGRDPANQLLLMLWADPALVAVTP